MGFRSKLLDFKTRLSKGHMYSITITAIAVVAALGIYFYKSSLDYRQMTELSYQRCFTEMTQYVNDLEITLLKGRLVRDPKEMIYLSGELYRQAASAKANLGQLPLSDVQLDNTSKFLSQVGDFSYSLSRRILRGDKMSAEETQSLKTLSQYAKTLSEGLGGLEEKLYSGTLRFGKVNRLTSALNGGAVAMAGEMENVEQEFHDYPALIYDGPFSQHLEDKAPVFLQGKNEISADEAIQKAKTLLPDAGEFTLSGEGAGNIPSYSLCAKNDDRSVCLEYTKQGGALLWMLNDRAIERESVDMDEARLTAMAFLQKNGYESMTESYYEKQNGSVTINFAYSQNGYTAFPDLVKVKVALDNGEIVGIESKGYIVNHAVRDIPTPKISEDKAVSNAVPGAPISEVSRAIIPLEGGREVFCYQLKGKIDEKSFLIYVNTQTGDEEKILILLENENGTLAV